MLREDIYAALFAYFSGLTNGGNPLFQTATRRLSVWEDVEKEEQPALLQLQRRESVIKTKGLPPKWTLTIELYMYVNTGAQNDPDIVPSQLLNPLMDAVEASLAIDDIMEDRCTLGGLVYRCYIDGAVEIFEGSLGDQAVCIIPITVIVPS